MGEAIIAFFQPVLNLLGHKAEAPKAPPPKVGGYVVDYSGLTDSQIAAPAACDDMFKTGNWVSVNRKS